MVELVETTTTTMLASTGSAIAFSTSINAYLIPKLVIEHIRRLKIDFRDVVIDIV